MRRLKTRNKLIAIILVLVCVNLLYAFYKMDQNHSTLQHENDFIQVLEINQKKAIGDFLFKPHEKLQNLTNINRSYSRAKQDKVVYDILKKKKGFFVEIAARGGQFPSNTLWLERQHDWTGLLIEAKPELCKKIDKLKRHSWRFCACLSTTQENATFSEGAVVGGLVDNIDDHHINMLDQRNKLTVPCFSLEQVLDEIGVHHIDFYSVDVEGGERAFLESLKHGLKYGTFIVDIWSIKYRAWSGKQVNVKKSRENLHALRTFFDDIGGYFEHSQLSTDVHTEDGYALDVVFIRTDTWCKTRDYFPTGIRCPGTHRSVRIKDYLLSPHSHKVLRNADKRYSQARQDEAVFDIVQKKNGFFVEIGAYDGQSLSNTLWLERWHSWTGLLIEANPQLCQKIDMLERHAWRLCACLSDILDRVVFINGDKAGGVLSTMDRHHMRMLNRKPKVTVPCFSLENVLNEIKTYHIDYFSLDVEGAEIQILESLRKGLLSQRFTVDVWTIEYRVWDGQQVVYKKSLANLKALRKYFKDIGGYSEHSQLSPEDNPSDGRALDIIFVRNEMYCKTQYKLPNGMPCSP